MSGAFVICEHSKGAGSPTLADLLEMPKSIPQREEEEETARPLEQTLLIWEME